MIGRINSSKINFGYRIIDDTNGALKQAMSKVKESDLPKVKRMMDEISASHPECAMVLEHAGDNSIIGFSYSNHYLDNDWLDFTILDNPAYNRRKSGEFDFMHILNGLVNYARRDNAFGSKGSKIVKTEPESDEMADKILELGSNIFFKV